MTALIPCYQQEWRIHQPTDNCVNVFIYKILRIDMKRICFCQSIVLASRYFNPLSGSIHLVISCEICPFVRMCGQDRTQESIWEDGCSCNRQGSGPAVEKVHAHRLVPGLDTKFWGHLPLGRVTLKMHSPRPVLTCPIGYPLSSQERGQTRPLGTRFTWSPMAL